MAKQMIDTTLRQQIAQWTRAALGQLVEDDGTMDACAPIEKSLKRRRIRCRRRFIVRIADLSANANPTTYPGYFVHHGPDGSAGSFKSRHMRKKGSAEGTKSLLPGFGDAVWGTV